jgi:hypothetical protein
MPLSDRLSEEDHNTETMHDLRPQEERGEFILNQILNGRSSYNVFDQILAGNLTASQICALADIADHNPDMQSKNLSGEKIRSLAELGQMLFLIQGGQVIDVSKFQQELKKGNIPPIPLLIMEDKISSHHPQKVEITQIITLIQTNGIVQ